MGPKETREKALACLRIDDPLPVAVCGVCGQKSKYSTYESLVICTNPKCNSVGKDDDEGPDERHDLTRTHI